MKKSRQFSSKNLLLPIDFGESTQSHVNINDETPPNGKKSRLDIKARKEKPLYDLRNKLNDLTGAEWQFATKTVINKIYPSNLQHKLRSQHGGQKPPQLCADLIKIFTKSGQLVFDPLAGVGGTLIGAALANRKAIGIELNIKWINIYNEVCKLEGLETFTVINGDANDKILEIQPQSVDFILTDVPYWIMDRVTKTRSSKAKRDSKLSNFNDKDLQSKSDWLADMKSIFSKAVVTLKSNGYIAVFIGDMYRGKEYHFLAGELAQKLNEIPGLFMKSDIIWHDDSKMLHIYGYPFAYIPSLIHQHILIFRKENI